MTNNQNPKRTPLCPDCNSNTVVNIGKIPSTNQFAGRTLNHLIEGGVLWQCSACHLCFRWPRLDKKKLDALYSVGAKFTWGRAPTERTDWLIAKQLLQQALPDESSILDIGCFDGKFLNTLEDSYTRFGIEIHPAARKRAEMSGISIISDDFELITQKPASVDCVTAFDVIEHVHHPTHFLARCWDIVKPGGLIIISTGNTNSLSFRFMGAKYWYCTIAEHISFINPDWCQNISKEVGLSIEKQVIFSHKQRNLGNFSSEILKNTIYRVTPKFFVWLRQHDFGNLETDNFPELAFQPPGWMTAKDHFITMFRKN